MGWDLTIAVTESPPRDSDIKKHATGDFGSPRCSTCEKGKMMIQINLQWLAFPCFFLSVIALFHAVYCIATTYGKSDILPMLGVGMAVRDFVVALMASGLGWLIWRAFRQ
jgi:hypothetical protein